MLVGGRWIVGLVIISITGITHADDPPMRSFIAPTYPFEGVVVTSGELVRSGPGKQHYPTSRLSRGERVVVHRVDHNDWYAITPPAGSFSWVQAEYIQKILNNRGKVLSDRVIAFIGSSLAQERSNYQRTLNRGDEVVILGEVRLPTSQGMKTYYKIQPPVREYRWIAREAVLPVSEPPPAPVESPPSLKPLSSVNGPVATRDEPHDQEFLSTPANLEERRYPQEIVHDPPDESESTADEATVTMIAASPIQNAPHEDSPWYDTPSHEVQLMLELEPYDSVFDHTTSLKQQLSQFELPTTSSASETGSTMSDAVQVTDAEKRAAFHTRDAALQKMLLEDPSIWNLEPFENDYRAWYDNTQDPALKSILEQRLTELRMLQQLLTVYISFRSQHQEIAKRDAAIAQRHRLLEQARMASPNRTLIKTSSKVTETSPSKDDIRSYEIDLSTTDKQPNGVDQGAKSGEQLSTPVASTRTSDPHASISAAPLPLPRPEPSNSPPQPRRYDGVGIIVPLPAHAPYGYRYALITPSGKLLAYLLPLASVNLDTAIHQAVGVYGQRSQHPALGVDVIDVRAYDPVRILWTP